LQTCSGKYLRRVYNDLLKEMEKAYDEIWERYRMRSAVKIYLDNKEILITNARDPDWVYFCFADKPGCKYSMLASRFGKLKNAGRVTQTALWIGETSQATNCRLKNSNSLRRSKKNASFL
jgi:hypothetical protein